MKFYPDVLFLPDFVFDLERGKRRVIITRSTGKQTQIPLRDNNEPEPMSVLASRDDLAILAITQFIQVPMK